MLKHMFLAQWQVNRLFPVTQSIPHEVQYLVAKQLQNGDTQLERSCWQNYTTIMDWFVFEIHLLWFELAWTHTHTQVQLPTVCRHAVQMPQVQAIAINPTSQLSFFHSCHLQTATASNSSNPSFCTFQSKKICSACGKGANNRYTSAGFTSSSCEDQHGCLSLSIRAARTPS